MSNDLYADITQRIITALEAGTPPWVRPWSKVPEAFPMNAISHRPYRGMNFTLLTLDSLHKGYVSNRWLTFLQAQSVGAHVRAGERGTTVVFWKPRDAAQGTEGEDSQRPAHGIPILRAYTVFNVGQVAGLPHEFYAPAPPPAWAPIVEAERLLDASGATVLHGGPTAFYQPNVDRIYLPEKRTFLNATRYYGTALHELAHWTGHLSRCNRQLGRRFGEQAYAMEELIAEMGSAFLCAHCRIDGELHHAAYLQSWLSVLRQDKRAIFTAATKAQAAADFVLRTSQPANANIEEVSA